MWMEMIVANKLGLLNSNNHRSNHKKAFIEIVNNEVFTFMKI